MHSYIYLVTEKSNLLANNGTHVFLTNKNVNKIEAQKDLEKITGKFNVKYVGVFSKNFKKTIQVDLNKLKGFIDNH